KTSYPLENDPDAPFCGGGNQIAEKPALRNAFACDAKWSHQKGIASCPSSGDGTPAVRPGPKKNPCSNTPMIRLHFSGCDEMAPPCTPAFDDQAGRPVLGTGA